MQQVSLPASAANVYANMMSGVVPCPLCNLPPRVYVPNSGAGTVDVINPLTFKVIDHFAVGSIPHHIAPAWDMSALYVDNEASSSLTVINTHTGRPAGQISMPFLTTSTSHPMAPRRSTWSNGCSASTSAIPTMDGSCSLQLASLGRAPITWTSAPMAAT